jgi:hypothetical protein
MASPKTDLRAACYSIAVEVTGVAKVPPLTFWKEASVEERTLAVEKWREAVYGKVPPVNKAILDFTFANYGKQVNNGECAMLVMEALRAATGRPVKVEGNKYVWGRALADGETARAGDIVQLEEAKFTNGASSPHHTQIIRRVLGPGRYEVLEQNVAGRRTVGWGKLNLKLLVQGTIVIYRPIPMVAEKDLLKEGPGDAKITYDKVAKDVYKYRGKRVTWPAMPRSVGGKIATFAVNPEATNARKYKMYAVRFETEKEATDSFFEGRNGKETITATVAEPLTITYEIPGPGNVGKEWRTETMPLLMYAKFQVKK